MSLNIALNEIAHESKQAKLHLPTHQSPIKQLTTEYQLCVNHLKLKKYINGVRK